MADYWVTLGYWDNVPMDAVLRPKMERVLEKLGTLANRKSKFKQLSYVTQDLDEAKSIHAQAVEIVRTEQLECMPSIIRQPECPRCAYSGRFSDEYCFKCGGSMTPGEFFA